MTWQKMLAYISGSVDDMSLKRVEYLIEENKVLRGQLDKRVKLTDAERKTLAKKVVVLGKLMLRGNKVAGYANEQLNAKGGFMPDRYDAIV